MAFKSAPKNKRTNPAAPAKKGAFTRMDALTVREYEAEGETKSAFTRIGAAFVYEDGNISVMLDALPVNGKLLIRHPLPPRE